jgi:hypothetical protein
MKRTGQPHSLKSDSASSNTDASVPTSPKPRGGPQALAGERSEATGSLSVPPHTLSLREKSSAMVLLNWPPPDHLWIGTKSRQFLPSQRCASMTKRPHNIPR